MRDLCVARALASALAVAVATAATSGCSVFPSQEKSREKIEKQVEIFGDNFQWQRWSQAAQLARAHAVPAEQLARALDQECEVARRVAARPGLESQLVLGATVAVSECDHELGAPDVDSQQVLGHRLPSLAGRRPRPAAL